MSLETVDPEIARREFLRLMGGGVLAVLGLAGTGCLPGTDSRLQLQDYLFSRYSAVFASEGSEGSEQRWNSIYIVKYDDTISGIAKEFYPGFNKDPLFYTQKLQFANGQDRRKNLLIRPGQALYIPDPRIPTLGFAAGEEAVLRGKRIDGKDWPTTIETIDTRKRLMVVHYYNGSVEVPLRVDEEFATSRGLRIVAVLDRISGLDGKPDLVPPRVVLELMD